MDVRRKTGVDPGFRFDYESKCSDTVSFYQSTSDDFFTRQALSNDKYDLIFLDGLHTYEQTFRDFCATLAYSHSQTIWLLDDTVPISLPSSIPDPRKFAAVRRNVGDTRAAWMGDVYKVVFSIHDFFPQFNYATFESGHGQTVIWRSTRQAFSPRWNNLELISRLDYADFLMCQDLMHFSSADKIYESIASSFGSADAS